MRILLSVVLVLILIPVLGFLFLLVSGFLRARAIFRDKPLKARVEEIEQRPGYVPFEEISEKCIFAITGTEDIHFFSHHGMDWEAWFKAMKYNVLVGFWKVEVYEDGTRLRKLHGASTITNQLAKNLFLPRQRTVTRKITEYFVTRELEKNLSKRRMMALYLNVIDYADDCIGIGPASAHYYRITPKELGINQATSLQAIIKYPSGFHPLRNPVSFGESRRFSINALFINRIIDQKTADHLRAMEWNAPDDENVQVLETPPGY